MKASLLATVFISLACALTVFGNAQDNKMLSLMPIPASVQPGAGEFVIGAAFKVGLEGNGGPVVERAVDRFLHGLWQRTGIPLRRLQNDSAATFTITCSAHGSPVQSSGEVESYLLELTTASIRCDSLNPFV